ncbi:Phosphodiesterase [Plasmodium coatneyi]|uniref:Phosphodiesterase n=1 Tax=Plasmodium coatneyi TaxID=208452 RepID=A0A1B1DUS7_9APIC|nr:Phosphodiesterase [Plasmodium coatneyi]ANQ06530.1 Phosphodiesterase [Plasmodium coatneyi]
METKIDKEDSPGKDPQALRKRYNSEKDFSRSFEAYERGETKYDEEDNHTASLLHGYSFKIKKKSPVKNGKNYLWLKMKDKARRRSESEYHNCVRRNNSRLTCFVKKYMKYFSDLKRRSYKTSSYENDPNTSISFGNRLGTIRSNPNFSAHMKKGLSNEGNFKFEPEDSLSMGQILGGSFLHKVVDLFASPFRSLQEGSPPNNSNHCLWNEVTPFLIFKNASSEEAFMDKFYASLPFKIIVYSTLMILTSLVNFFILHFGVFSFEHPVGKAAIYINVCKLLLDIFYFSFFVIYIFFFSSNCIERMSLYSYNSSYLFASLRVLCNLVLLHVLPPSVTINGAESTRVIDFNPPQCKKDHHQQEQSTLPSVQAIVIFISCTYLCVLCCLKNYIILHHFALSFKFSLFCILCVFTLCAYSYGYLHFPYNDVVVLFCFSLCLLVLSLWYEYRFERRGRASFMGRRQGDEVTHEGKNTSEAENTEGEKNTDEAENTDYEENAYEVDRRKMARHYMTKYFSIDNTTPTSPIEDILNNLKYLLDHMKKLEEDASEKKLSEIGKMREKIKMCENILRTQNLNEVQICKYRKFERVYNMWCLDKIENNYCEKNDECKSYLSQSLNKKSFNTFSNIHSLLSSKFQEQHNYSFEWKSDIELLYKRNVFISIGYKLLYPLGVLEASFDKEKLKNFLLKMYSLYNHVPYHNSLHAAQVAHFSKSMLFLLDINHKIPAIDEFCLHVSSLCHDVGHPGLNNYFLINSENNIALTYNDNSVLENYHCSLVFKTLKEKNCNVFENYPYNIFTTCKKNIIRAILSTDMKNHFEYISNFRTSKEFIDLDILTSEQIWQIFSLILKAADIGHATLDWNKHYEWTIKINEEFYLQGLLEKSLNMPNSFLCDINSIDKLATSQIGFLKHLCIPLFSELNSISKNDEVYNQCICSIENNIEQWDKRKNNQKSLGLHEKYRDENLMGRIKLLKFV